MNFLSFGTFKRRDEPCGAKAWIAGHIELLERQRLNVFSVRPGILGFKSEISECLNHHCSLNDAKMISQLSTYFKYIFLTLMGGAGDKISDL